MAVSLDQIVNEQSSTVYSAAFTDENGDPVTPDSVLWTLTTTAGTVVNSRCNVSISPSATVNIVLSGDDLAMLTETEEIENRQLLVEAEYTSATFGSLPLTSVTRFGVRRVSGLDCS